MQAPVLRRAFAGGLLAALLSGPAARAHHGWSWAEDEQVTLTGTVREVYIGQPHPTLRVETPGDGLWLVELGNPRQTERSGFVEGSAKPGDRVTVLGNRSRQAGERRMKAVRLTLGERRYDIYPERIQGG
ncbi:hypothetical protein E0493_17455 [Roseomonas sp. M0104]|uniref:Uncharacterized protein n=1 Tax=Teichococcus coralli TaxID=2545983 RepID=A0A845BGA6_9PROT|nr:DUF6152 family protein [Pseudoroseomonas coralli]MXP65136.1 hypothetical protein [Pseudoroseomonas coralli]